MTFPVHGYFHFTSHMFSSQLRVSALQTEQNYTLCKGIYLTVYGKGHRRVPMIGHTDTQDTDWQWSNSQVLPKVPAKRMH